MASNRALTSNRALNIFLASLPLILLASCASESPQSAQSTQDKKAELCTNLARFNTSVATLKSMSPSSTVGDFRTAREQVQATFAEVKSSAAMVQDSKAGELESAYQNLDKTIGAVSDTATLSQAAASIAPQVAAVEAAQAQMRSGLNCP